MANENINSMRIYDFNTLMKSMKTQDVSNIKNYSIPLEKMPKVKDQQDYCCCRLPGCGLQGGSCYFGPRWF